MPISPPTVGLISASLWGNRGAEAMLVTTIGQVRETQPDAHFHLFTYTPQQDARLITDPRITIINSRPLALVLQFFLFACLVWVAKKVRITWPDALLPQSVRALRSCTVLLNVGGISFADGREKMLPFNILNTWPALLLDVPVVRLSQAMGSFNHPLTRWSARRFLFRCQHVFARGEQTATHLRQLGLPAAQWDLATDIAFLYRPAYSLSTENADHVAALTVQLTQSSPADGPLIALSPSSLVYQKCLARDFDYLALFLDLVQTLPPDYRYVFLPNATKQGQTTAHNNDLHVIQLLHERAQQTLAPEVQARLFWVDYDINTAGSRQLLACCDLVITSRFHAMISSLCLQKPVLVVGWSHKYVEVMASFGLEQFVVDYADDTLNLAALVNTIWADRDTITELLANNLPQVQQAAAGQFDYIARLLR